MSKAVPRPGHSGWPAKSATVTLNLVIEKEQYENIRSILEALQPGASLEPEQFSEALTKTHQAHSRCDGENRIGLGMSYHLRPHGR